MHAGAVAVAPSARPAPMLWNAKISFYVRYFVIRPPGSDLVLLIEGCKFAIKGCVNDIGSAGYYQDITRIIRVVGYYHKFEILMADSEP